MLYTNNYINKYAVCLTFTILDFLNNNMAILGMYSSSTTKTSYTATTQGYIHVICVYT